MADEHRNRYLKNAKVSVNWTEATKREKIESDENISKSLGKIAKLFTDLEETQTAFTGDAKTVNGKTVGTDVPTDALFLTSAERTKLSGVESGANKIIVDSSLSNSSTNPVQNKVIKSELDNKVDSSLIGTANGIVPLGSDSKISSVYLPSYVDDVIEGYYDFAAGKFYENTTKTKEITPETGKIYTDLSTDTTWRWSGTQYTQIKGDLTLGETHTTAYYGDLGKTAYDHSQITSGNPHNVTKSDVGLGNVDNTADKDKTVSKANQLTNSKIIDGVEFNGTKNISHFGICSTPAGTVAKEVECEGFVLSTGASIAVKFTVTNTAAKPTLNVNGTGDVPIYYRSSVVTAGRLAANSTFIFVYDGTNYNLIGIDVNSTYSNLGFGHATGSCTTAKATLAKTVTLSSYTATTHGYVSIVFTNDVPAGSTLNINSRGDKPIFYKGVAIIDGVINSGDRATFVYDGTNYQLISVDSVIDDVHTLKNNSGTYENKIESIKDSGGTVLTIADDKSVTLTKSAIGLSNVENKSSATIRGELTKENVTTALGYTPPTEDTKPVVMTGATSSKGGTSGYVPAPAKGQQNSFLRGDGNWISISDENTKYGISGAYGTNGNTWVTTITEGGTGTTSTVPTATTSVYGITKLSDSTNSNVSTTAATSKAVKSAYDLANTAKTTADGKSIVSFTQSLTSGTTVGKITINGTETTLYAPTNTNTTYSLSGAYGSSSNTWITTLTPSSGTATTSTVPTASTSVYGITKLSSSTSSTSTALAATASAVKSAYDLANTANTLAGTKSIVSITPALTSGTKIGTITIDGTGTDLYCQTNTDNDTKVTQNVSSANKDYPILLSQYTTSQTTTTANTTNRVASVYVNPSTGMLTAGSLRGELNYLRFKVNRNAVATYDNNSVMDIDFDEGSVNGAINIVGTTLYVHGLQSAAYTKSSDYATKSHTHTASEVTDLGTAATYTVSTTVGNDTKLPTGSAIQTYVTGLGYTSNKGTVTSITPGDGIVNGANAGTTNNTSKTAITASGTLSLQNSGVTAGSYGLSADATPAYGATFNVPYITVDKFGRVTSASTQTVKIPASDNSDTKVNVTLGTGTKAYLLATSTTPKTSAQAITSIADTGVYLTANSGELQATNYIGKVNGFNLGMDVPSGSSLTDENVKQSRSVSTKYRSLLLGYTENTYSKDTVSDALTNVSYQNELLRAIPKTGKLFAQGGYWYTRGSGETGVDYPLIMDNGTNLWIGAPATAAAHHLGATYISSGWNSTNNAGNETIYISIPKSNNTDGSSYEVLHRGNTYHNITTTDDSWTDIGIPISTAHRLVVVRGGTGSNAVNPPDWWGGANYRFGAGIAFAGSADSAASISMRTNGTTPGVTFAGGSRTSTYTKPRWYISITGTSGTTYDLSNMTATKLGTDSVGNSYTPIYLNSGTPTAITYGSSGDWWTKPAFIRSSGVMEIGRYIDFHGTKDDTTNFGIRLDVGTTAKNTLVATNVVSSTDTSNPTSMTLAVQGINQSVLNLRTYTADGSKTYSGYITARQARNADGTVNDNGQNWTIQSGGNMIIGSGEFPHNFYNRSINAKAEGNDSSYVLDDPTLNGETMYIGSDTSINFYTNAGNITYSNAVAGTDVTRKWFMGTGGNFRLPSNLGTIQFATTNAAGTTYTGTITAPTLTSSLTYTLPSATGTIALVSDIPTKYAGSTSAGGAATTVTSTLTNPTSSTTYAITFHSGASTGAKSLLNNNGLVYLTLEGTTSAQGYGGLILGNSTASGTAGNKYGLIRMYGNSTSYMQLSANAGANTIRLSHSSSTAGSNFSPATTNVYDLGTSSLLWRNIYATTLYEGTSSLSNKYLQLSGGTMTGRIERTSGGLWINARDDTIIYANANGSTRNEFYPAMAAKTKTGLWSIGSNGSAESLYFDYTTDANYTNSANTHIGAVLTATTGTTKALGYTTVLLGNDVASGTENNNVGRIQLYGSGKNFGSLVPGSLSATRTWTLPDYTGNVMVTGVGTPFAEGEDVDTVPIDANYHWYSQSAARSATLVNTPWKDSGFQLINIPITTTSTYIKQFLLPNSATIGYLWRYRSNGSWSNGWRSPGTGFFYIKGTQTAATATWTGSIPLPALYDGLTIAYYLPYAGVSGTSVTLNLTLSNGNKTGDIEVYQNSTTRLTTHYGAGSTIILTYWGAGSIRVSGTATTAARWTRCDYNTNTNTLVTQNVTTANTNYPLLLSNYATSSTTTTAAAVNRATGIYANASTGTITATTFNGTATKVTGTNRTANGTYYIPYYLSSATESKTVYQSEEFSLVKENTYTTLKIGKWKSEESNNKTGRITLGNSGNIYTKSIDFGSLGLSENFSVTLPDASGELALKYDNSGVYTTIFKATGSSNNTLVSWSLDAVQAKTYLDRGIKFLKVFLAVGTGDDISNYSKFCVDCIEGHNGTYVSNATPGQSGLALYLMFCDVIVRCNSTDGISIGIPTTGMVYFQSSGMTWLSGTHHVYISQVIAIYE